MDCAAAADGNYCCFAAVPRTTVQKRHQNGKSPANMQKQLPFQNKIRNFVLTAEENASELTTHLQSPKRKIIFAKQ